jgi:hydroxymethylbilane synthase
MGWADRATQVFSPEEMIPAIGQGALAIEVRANDADVRAALTPLRDPDAEACVEAERALLARLGGGCQVPLAAHAVLKHERLRLAAVVVSLDAARAVRGVEQGPQERAAELGTALAERLLSEGAREILAAIAESSQGPPGAA